MADRHVESRAAQDSGGAPPRLLAYRSAAPAPASNLYFPSKTRDLIVPAILLAAAVALGIGVMVHDGSSFGDAVRRGSAYSVTKLLILLACIPLATRVAGVTLGTLPQATLKLSVVALLPDALALLAISMLGCTGMVLAPVIGFVACWLLFGVLFETGFSESGFCSAVYWGAGTLYSRMWFVLYYYLF